jgi:hypothetical protein
MAHDNEDKKYYPLGDPKNIRRVRFVLYTLCTLSLAGELFVHRHVDHPWEALPGFYALYGFVACVLLVLIAKEMRKVIMRGEDYYDG